MAEFTEERTPYEFLVRWDENGNIRGAHIGWVDTVKKDGVILTQKPSNVESVSLGVGNGFPLEDLLSHIQVDAFKQIDLLNGQLELKSIEVNGLNSQLSQLEGNLESKQNLIEDLQEKIQWLYSQNRE